MFHDVDIEMKNGDRLSSCLWIWRPKEGWFALIDDGFIKKCYGTIFLRDVKSAIERDVHVTYNKIEDVDLLKRAKEEGWNE